MSACEFCGRKFSHELHAKHVHFCFTRGNGEETRKFAEPLYCLQPVEPTQVPRTPERRTIACDQGFMTWLIQKFAPSSKVTETNRGSSAKQAKFMTTINPSPRILFESRMQRDSKCEMRIGSTPKLSVDVGRQEKKRRSKSVGALFNIARPRG